MKIFEKCERLDNVARAKEWGLYPYFHVLNTRQDTEVEMEGKKILMIGSNNYLGLTSDKRVIEAGVKALEKYGSGCSGSRFLNGTLETHVALEKELAEFLHKEDAVTFSTGFQSNLGIISAIAGRTDTILCDKENHASIYDGCRLSFAKMLRYNHSDMEDLENKLASLDLSVGGALIVTDGVFSMSGEICKLPEIVRLAKKYGAGVMVDDAHGLGVLGEGGRGTASHFHLEDEVDIYMGTFSKSLASLGGYMAANKKICEYVRHVSRPFIFSASITPASVACAREALAILKAEPERVQKLAHISDFMRAQLKKRGVKIIESTTPIIPVYTYDDKKTFEACKILFDNGVYFNPVVSPATPVGMSLLRTSYTATHTEEQMVFAAEKIASALKQLKII